ncbi:MAG: ketoacyl-ACP synthase III [Flavobacteriaceae bacterium]|nr:ketoacyl-ACP synthase III [Flavobacteriaceae bacterium]
MQLSDKHKLKAAITGVGGYLPDDILTNSDLEKMVDTSDEWIVTRTGIRERRLLKIANKGTSYLCVKAIEDLLSKTDTDPLTIDAVILATVTPDFQVSPTSSVIISEIGAHNAFGFDLSAACSGFLYALSTATSYVSSGRYQKVIVVGGDMMSSLVDYTDRTTCILFGDGAGAVLIEPSQNGFGFEDEYCRSDGYNQMLLGVKAGGSLYPTSIETVKNKWHKLYQDGPTVYKRAVSEMYNATFEILKRNGLDADTIDFFLAHQANKRIIDSTANRIGIDSVKVLLNIDRYGNTTCATIPLLLYDYENQFKIGSKMIITAFGGGFTWGSAYLTWAY